MALTDAELTAAKRELGYNLLSTDQPYIGTSTLFEQVIVPNLDAAAEAVVRSILADLADVATSISAARKTAGLRKVDDVEFHGGGNTLGSTGVDPLHQLFTLRESHRDELASVLGVPRLNKGDGSSIAVY